MANVVSHAAWVSSLVALVVNASLLAVSVICCIIASTKRVVSISASFTPLLAVASAVACCFMCSFCARFSNCACSSCSVTSSSRCLAIYFVNIIGCLPLYGSKRSSRCSVSGVRGIGSRPRLPRDLNPTLFAPETDLNIIRSLS